MAGANFCGIGVSHDWDSLRVRHVGRAVPALAFGIARVNLDELREVATVGKRGRDCGLVKLESIGADLEALARGRVPQAFDKGVRSGFALEAHGGDSKQLGIP